MRDERESERAELTMVLRRSQKTKELEKKDNQIFSHNLKPDKRQTRYQIFNAEWEIKERISIIHQSLNKVNFSSTTKTRIEVISHTYLMSILYKACVLGIKGDNVCAILCVVCVCVCVC